MGYEGRYEVSDDGRVRGPRGERRLFFNEHVGKWQVTLYDERGHRTKKVHLLVLEAFAGPRPIGAHGLHWNDNPDDNSIGNLRWGTASENKLDEVRNGLHANARKTQCKRGHELNEKNVYINPTSGSRQCRVCTRLLAEARR